MTGQGTSRMTGDLGERRSGAPRGCAATGRHRPRASRARRRSRRARALVRAAARRAAVQAWRLFAIFAAAIFVGGRRRVPDPDGVGASRSRPRCSPALLAPAEAYAGFANGDHPADRRRVPGGARGGEVRAGRARRPLRRQRASAGRRSGSSYSIFLVDARDRAGVSEQHRALGRALSAGVLAGRGGRRDGRTIRTRRRLGAFLMFSGIASLSLSSALWLTAMAANPLGAEIARAFGVEIGFGSWLLAASVPTLVAHGAAAAGALQAHRARGARRRPRRRPRRARRSPRWGRSRRDEKIVAVTFVGMVALWASAATLGHRLDRGGVSRPRRPARHRRADARRHREGRRRARDLHLVRRALHAEQPAQRARLHGVSRRAARRRDGRPGRWPWPA